MSGEVREFARELFLYLKETVYRLKDRGDCKGQCKWCSPIREQSPSGFTTDIANAVVSFSLEKQKHIRNCIRNVALHSTKLSYDVRIELWKYAAEISRLTKCNEGIIFILAMISEMYLFRYFKLQRDFSPCYYYVNEASSCFFFVYENVLKVKYKDFQTLFKDMRKQEKCVLNREMGMWISNLSNKSTWSEKGYNFQSQIQKNLIHIKLLVPESDLRDHLTKLAEKYEKLKQIFPPDPECNLFSNYRVAIMSHTNIHERDLLKELYTRKLIVWETRYKNIQTGLLLKVLRIDPATAELLDALPMENETPIMNDREQEFAKKFFAQQKEGANFSDLFHQAIKENYTKYCLIPNVFESYEESNQILPADPKSILFSDYRDSRKDAKGIASNGNIFKQRDFLREQLTRKLSAIESSDALPMKHEILLRFKDENPIAKKRKQRKRKKKNIDEDEISLSTNTENSLQSKVENPVKGEIQETLATKDRNFDSVDVKRPAEDLKSQCRSPHKVQPNLTNPKENDRAQRFAKDLFSFLKNQVFSLKEDCKCKVCENKDELTPSAFTPALGVKVLTLSLTRRKFFRGLVKTVVLKYYDPILIPEQESDIWKEISKLSRDLVNRYQNGITYVFSLISEAYLFRYVKLRRFPGSNPCNDYLRAALSCFLYVYSDVFRGKKDDFGDLVKDLECCETYEGKYEELLNRIEAYFSDEVQRLENLKNSKERDKWQFLSIKEVLEPEFVISCEFVDPLNEEKDAILKRSRKCYNKYKKFYDAFVENNGKSSVLIEGNTSPTEKKDNPAETTNRISVKDNFTNAKNVAQLKSEISVESIPKQDNSDLERIESAKSLETDLTVNPILEYFLESLVGDFSDCLPGFFQPQSIEEFAIGLFYSLKKLFKLNDSCRCEICLNYEGLKPSRFNIFIATYVFFLSLTKRDRFRQFMHRIFLSCSSPHPFKYPCDYTKIVSLSEYYTRRNGELGILLSLSLISEIQLYMCHRFKGMFEPCKIYIGGALKCFKYVYDRVFPLDFPDFKYVIESVYVYPKYYYYSQRLIFNVYNFFRKQKDCEEVFGWWFNETMKNDKLPHSLIITHQYIDPLKKKGDIKNHLTALSKRHNKLRKKHFRHLLASHPSEYYQIFPCGPIHVYEDEPPRILPKRRNSV